MLPKLTAWHHSRTRTRLRCVNSLGGSTELHASAVTADRWLPCHTAHDRRLWIAGVPELGHTALCSILRHSHQQAASCETSGGTIVPGWLGSKMIQVGMPFGRTCHRPLSPSPLQNILKQNNHCFTCLGVYKQR